MKTIILSIAIAISTFLAKAQNNNTSTDVTGVTITVTVPVQTNEGSVLFGLYDEATFMKTMPLQGLESKIEDGKATITFTNVAPGTYGITVLHDRNGNKNMDFDANGMPLENYGVSNNTMSYGPPQWGDAKFDVADEPIEMEIRL
ncbi:MAG: DUF2141 domain-containing protein [Bacteroidota bacterium]